MPANHKSQAKYHSNTDSQLLIPENWPTQGRKCIYWLPISV